MADIKDVHPDYKKYKKRWEQIKSCKEGEEAVKFKQEILLPYPVSITDIDRASKEFQGAYNIYLNGAHFVEYTGEAIDDLVASAFREDPTINPEIPLDLEYFEWEDTSKDIMESVVTYGRNFALVDYPEVEDPTLSDDMENQAFVEIYDALDVINWTVTKRSGTQRITRVVLRETIVDEDNKNSYQYRELLLDKNVYTQRVYQDGSDGYTEIIPVAMGKTLDFIPGCFTGVTSNTSKMDKPPVLGISNSNIKHYQTWAELIWTQTYVGHPQMVLSGLPAGWNKEAEKKKVKIKMDASQVLALEGDTSKAQILEINTSNLVHFQTLERLEASMTEQGYRLKSSAKAGVESAEALKIRHAGDISKLGAIVTNVNATMEKLMEWLGMFMGTTYEPIVEINREFLPYEIEGSMVSTLTSAENSNTVPKGTTIDYLKMGGVISTEETTEAMVAKLGETDPLLPGNNPADPFDPTNPDPK
jgi:hypothetical protein